MNHKDYIRTLLMIIALQLAIITGFLYAISQRF